MADYARLSTEAVSSLGNMLATLDQQFQENIASIEKSVNRLSDGEVIDGSAGTVSELRMLVNNIHKQMKVIGEASQKAKGATAKVLENFGVTMQATKAPMEAQKEQLLAKVQELRNARKTEAAK